MYRQNLDTFQASADIHCRYESSWHPTMLLSRLATGPQYNVLAHQALLALTTRPYDRKINFIPLTGRSGRKTLTVIRVYDYDPAHDGS